MMSNSDLISWILENGGPAIQLRIFNSRPDNKKDINTIISNLLSLKEVNTALDYLDAFEVEAKDKKTLEHLIHYYKDTCIDNFFPRLLDLGFRAGMPVFDKKMQPVKKVFSYMLSQDFDYCCYYRPMLHRFIFMSGYADQEIAASMAQRINFIHKAAKDRIFDIFQDGNNLPKLPANWVDRGILKDALNPFSAMAQTPLPTIYDLSALAYFLNCHNDTETQAKADDIVEYILDPEFQKLPEGYGLIWDKAKRRYYACGWSPTLPLYKDYDRPSHLGSHSVLNYLSMMSNFRAAINSKWFKNCMKHVEQFRTEKGTYLFPKEYLAGKYICPGSTSCILGIHANLDEAFLSERNRRLKRNEREAFLRELAGTLNMVEIKSRIAELTRIP